MLGPLQTHGLLGNINEAQVPGIKAAGGVFDCQHILGLRRYAVTIIRGWFLLPPAGAAVSAGITAGARRSLCLRGLPPPTWAPPLWRGRASSPRGITASAHNREASSLRASAPCILHSLVGVANTLLREPTSSLHDDGLPSDRGKRLPVLCSSRPALTAAAMRVMDTRLS